jgi:hypothetical protein
VHEIGNRQELEIARRGENQSSFLALSLAWLGTAGSCLIPADDISAANFSLSFDFCWCVILAK